MAAKDPRLDAIRAALQGIPRADLRKAAASLPPALGQALTRVLDADPDGTLDDDALAAALARLPTPETLGSALGTVAPRVQAQAATLRAKLKAMGAQLERLQAHRDAVRTGFDELHDQVADAPEVQALLQRAAETIADDGPWTASRALLDQADALVAGLVGLTDPHASQGLDPQALADHGAELERAADQLHAATRPLLETVPALLDDAAAQALRQEHPVAPAVAIQAARAWEVHAGLNHPDAVRRWEQAFVTCLRFKVLPGAWVAGKRLQSAALPDEDYERVAVIAHQVADLAYAQGARPQAVMARMEEAQCLARVAEGRDAARTYAADALAVAESGDEVALRDQARLMHGQVLELLDEPTAAAQGYQAALAAAGDPAGWTGVHGRIALSLGRLLVAAQQPEAGSAHFDRAIDVGLAHGDGALLTATLTPAVALALAQERPDDAGIVLRAVVQALAKGGQEAEVVRQAAERWGTERVRAWLAG